MFPRALPILTFAESIVISSFRSFATRCTSCFSSALLMISCGRYLSSSTLFLQVLGTSTASGPSTKIITNMERVLLSTVRPSRNQIVNSPLHSFAMRCTSPFSSSLLMTSCGRNPLSSTLFFFACFGDIDCERSLYINCNKHKRVYTRILAYPLYHTTHPSKSMVAKTF